MATPTSTGIGQGAAQVFTGTRAADIFAMQAQLEEQRRLKRAADAAKAQQELSGKYDDLYKAELFETRDTDWYYNQVQTIKDKYAGNMEDLAKGKNPALTRQFQDDILDLRLKAKQSKAVKDQLKDVRKDMFIDHPELYSEEEKQKFETFVAKDNAGLMEVPRFTRKSGIDLDKAFTEQAYTPTAKMAADMFTRDGYYEQTLPSGKKIFVDSKSTTIPKEVAEEQWGLFLTKPENILAINERFGDEAEAKGVDPVQLAHDFYVPRLMINKRDMSSRNVADDSGGEGKSFEPGLLTKTTLTNLPWKKAAFQENETDFYPINFPVTVQTGSGAFDYGTGVKMPTNEAYSGSVVGIVSVPKNGSKIPYAIVKDAQGTAVAVPAEQVYGQGKQKGYDMDNIINGVVQQSAPAKKQIRSSDIPAKAAAAGYTVDEYTQMLNQKGVQITE
jgi:hypothetical protein